MLLTSSTLNDFSTFLVRSISDAVVHKLLYVVSFDKSKAKNIPIRIQESEGRIFLIVQELNLQDFPINVYSPTKLVQLALF